MNEGAKGTVLLSEQIRVTTEKLREMEQAIAPGSSSAAAGLVPFFGPVLAGDDLVPALGLDFARGLLVGQSYEWGRAVVPDEVLDVEIRIDDVFQKGPSQFGVVVTEARAADGEIVQRQRTTFIERRG
jgi:hypothetical protein